MRPRNAAAEERKKRNKQKTHTVRFFSTLFISLEMVCDGLFCSVYESFYFGRVCVAAFFCSFIECIIYNWHGLCANRKQDYGLKIEHIQSMLTLARSLKYVRDGDMTNGRTRIEQKIALTFWLINYARIQINTLIRMSKKVTKSTVTLHSIWMWIMFFLTHDKIIYAFSARAVVTVHRSPVHSFISNPLHYWAAEYLASFAIAASKSSMNFTILH